MSRLRRVASSNSETAGWSKSNPADYRSADSQAANWHSIGSDGSWDDGAWDDGDGWACGLDQALDGHRGSRPPMSFMLPLRYEPNYRYPLIVWLHSDGFNELQINQVMSNISLQNFVAVGVRGVRCADHLGHRHQWPIGPAAVSAAGQRISDAIADARDRYSIHADRIVLAGYRSGGTMAMKIALSQPQAFAGVISMGGGLPKSGRLFPDLSEIRRRRLPVLMQWAVRGDHFSANEAASDIGNLMIANTKTEIRQYDQDDEMNTVALGDINQWIMHEVVQGGTAESTVCDDAEVAEALVAFSDN